MINEYPRFPVEAVDIVPNYSLPNAERRPSIAKQVTDEVIVAQDGHSFRRVSTHNPQQSLSYSQVDETAHEAFLCVSPDVVLACSSDHGLAGLDWPSNPSIVQRSLAAQSLESFATLVFLALEGALIGITCIWVYLAYGKTGSESSVEPGISSAYRLLIVLALVGVLMRLDYQQTNAGSNAASGIRRASTQAIEFSKQIVSSLTGLAALAFLCGLISSVIASPGDDANAFNSEISTSWKSKVLVRAICAWLGGLASLSGVLRGTFQGFVKVPIAAGRKAV